ncbi:MAG: 23S rRNA (uracil-5-)-methyltransferase RumA [Desulfuromonadales bacterium GWC2_61_20]|nr:MAG: 23S rRNA (uracil-5-)-methyltransferase RumA [Desulfuromonadales bacterium GWC2_61_20]HAD04231.1 23S rRNA (uracil(1939)-C(5))-methyltransferase RlmD [Desulfuromonas sp.]
MTVELIIDRLAFGGNGVGRLDGKAIFVPFTAPGDRVRCRIVKDKGRWAEAELVELLSPAAQRVTPPCPVFGRCGGCQWQHLPYAEQAAAKEAIFREQLVRHADAPAEALLPVVQAPAPFAYRSRVQFKCHHTPSGFVLGFYRRGSHYVEDIVACPLVPDALNELLPGLRAAIAATSVADRVPQIDLSIDDAGARRAVVHVLPGAEQIIAAALEPVARPAGLALFLQIGRKETLLPVCGAAELTITCDEPPLRLAYGPGGFAQVNLAQNRSLVAAAMAAAQLQGGERVLDLYCGMGNFSLPLARRCREVVGVEDYAPSIAQATRNAAANGLANVRFLVRPATGALTQLAAAAPFDVVFLDPPRAGAYELCREFLAIRPPRIVYVSCDPATLARDLKPLLHNGYRLVSSQSFDFFPQTHHIESLTRLEWSGV